jgi:hypothetical protein
MRSTPGSGEFGPLQQLRRVAGGCGVYGPASMLERFYMNTVLPARDGDRARTFYRDVLRLKLVSGPADDPMMFQAGSGTGLVVTEIPDRVPPDYAVVSFLVDGIEHLEASMSVKSSDRSCGCAAREAQRWGAGRWLRGCGTGGGRGSA